MTKHLLLTISASTGLIILSSLIFLFFPNTKLLSPLSDMVENSPILKEKIALRVSTTQRLDFSKASSLPVLAGIPHYLVYNSDTGQVYAAKSASDRISPASFTKLMTATIALDIGLPRQTYTISFQSTQKEPTTLGLKAGEQFFLPDLLRGAIATSGNDSAAAIAESAVKPYGVDPSTFITLMNIKAKLLNMTNTSYANPEGYDDQLQYSTLSDQAKLIYNVQQNYPDILYAAKSDREDIPKDTTHGRYYLTNWNGLLGIYPGVDGLKIAYTENAGYSTIVTATRSGIKITALLTGADSIPQRDLAAAALLDHAFLTEGLPAINLTKRHLQPRYNAWNKLIEQTRKELEALKSNSVQ